MQSQHDPLEPLLESLRLATPPQPESLTGEIWRRIAIAEQPAAAPYWWQRIEMAFTRPAFAVAFVAVCIVTGLFMAEIQLTRLHAQRSALLEQSYLQLIDPLLDQPAQPVKATRAIHHP